MIGALYLGFAMLNWMAQGNVIGGIYSRPVAMANFTHFMIAGLALSKAVVTGEHPPALLAAALVYGVLAVLFAYVAFFLVVPGAKASAQ
jgi:hypothetical protein